MEQIKKKEYNFIFDSILLYLIVMLKTWLASAILRKFQSQDTPYTT